MNVCIHEPESLATISNKETCLLSEKIDAIALGIFFSECPTIASPAAHFLWNTPWRMSRVLLRLLPLLNDPFGLALTRTTQPNQL
jgi:hypothetical protein